MHRELAPQGGRLPREDHDHFIFEGMEFPATRQDLVDFAENDELDTDTLNLILSLPDRTYADQNDVWRSIAEATRVMAGGSGTGTPRDDIGREAVLTPDGMRHP
jgi:hypothetical protein